MVRQPYKYYCVVDYEASGEEDPYNPGHGSKDFPSEIIQFPAVLINSYTNSIVNIILHNYYKIWILIINEAIKNKFI